MSILFEKGKPEPKPRRKFLMHVIDAGPAWDSGSCIVVMQCKKCDLKTAWFEIKTVTEAKRGIRCPNCNVIDFETNELGEFIVPDSYK